MAWPRPLFLGSVGAWRLWKGWVLCCLWMCLSAGSTSARRRPAALHWVREPGAESCISPIELGRRVERTLGPVLVSAANAEISVEGSIRPAQEGFSVLIAVSNAAGQLIGQRTLEESATNCRKLDEALVFVIAVALDPDAALAELPIELSPMPGQDPAAELLAELEARSLPASSSQHQAATRSRPLPLKAPAPPPSVSGKAAAPVSDAPHAMFAVGADLALAGPLLPQLTVGAGGHFEVEPVTRWPFRLTAIYWWPQHVPAGVVDGTLTLRLWQVSVVACRRFLGASAWSVGLCAGLHGGRLQISSPAPAPSLTSAMLGFAVESYGTWTLMDPLRVRFAIGLQNYLGRSRLTYVRQDPIEVHELPRLTGKAQIAVETYF